MWKLRIGVLVTSGALGLAVSSPAWAAGSGNQNDGKIRVVVSPVITTSTPETAISAITITRTQNHKHHRTHRHSAKGRG